MNYIELIRKNPNHADVLAIRAFNNFNQYNYSHNYQILLTKSTLISFETSHKPLRQKNYTVLQIITMCSTIDYRFGELH